MYISNMTVADTLQSIVGMSVVGSDYDKLKKYNLAELRDSTIPKDKKEATEL